MYLKKNLKKKLLLFLTLNNEYKYESTKNLMISEKVEEKIDNQLNINKKIKMGFNQSINFINNHSFSILGILCSFNILHNILPMSLIFHVLKFILLCTFETNPSLSTLIYVIEVVYRQFLTVLTVLTDIETHQVFQDIETHQFFQFILVVVILLQDSSISDIFHKIFNGKTTVELEEEKKKNKKKLEVLRNQNKKALLEKEFFLFSDKPYSIGGMNVLTILTFMILFFSLVSLSTMLFCSIDDYDKTFNNINNNHFFDFFLLPFFLSKFHTPYFIKMIILYLPLKTSFFPTDMRYLLPIVYVFKIGFILFSLQKDNILYFFNKIIGKKEDSIEELKKQKLEEERLEEQKKQELKEQKEIQEKKAEFKYKLLLVGLIIVIICISIYKKYSESEYIQI
jgi:hypothetical protein